MRIIVTGGAGFLGTRVIELLLQRADAGTAPIPFTEIVSLDLAPSRVEDDRVSSIVGDITDPELLRQAIIADTVGIYHLAAVLSGGAESDFDLAMRVNVDGTRAILEAARAAGSTPRFVFTSSLAVFGRGVPAQVPEAWAAQPESSYGMVKAVGELLVNEYSRKGFVDGRICRLPTISVRPGTPNSAASSFLSGIIREPLNGIAAGCPVPEDTPVWISSPDAAAQNLVHALGVDGQAIGAWRAMNIPGISVTVAEMLAGLERSAGAEVRALVTDEPEACVADIVCSWPGDFAVDRLLELGFVRDAGIDEIITQYRAAFAPRSNQSGTVAAPTQNGAEA